MAAQDDVGVENLSEAILPALKKGLWPLTFPFSFQSSFPSTGRVDAFALPFPKR